MPFWQTLPNCVNSLVNYWIPVLRKLEERERLMQKIRSYPGAENMYAPFESAPGGSAEGGPRSNDPRSSMDPRMMGMDPRMMR